MPEFRMVVVTRLLHCALAFATTSSLACHFRQNGRLIAVPYPIAAIHFIQPSLLAVLCPHVWVDMLCT